MSKPSDASGKSAVPAIVPLEKKPNRKPGRPPKKKMSDVQIQTFGIVDTPQNPDSIVEMVYENPVLFKKICALYKKYSCTEITWEFCKDKIEIKMRDANKKCIIHSVIYGNMLIRYYCKEPIIRTVRRENLDKIFRSMDKNYPKVSIVLFEDDSRSKMYVVAENNEVRAGMNYNTSIICESDQRVTDELPDSKDYPIKFQLPSRHLKKLVNDISLGGDILTVKKEEGQPLKITYNVAKKVALAATYNDNETIKLQCGLDPTDIFAVSILIKNIKPFSDSNIGEMVHIAVDKYKDFSAWSDVDIKKFTNQAGQIVEGPVCKIHVFSKIETC